MTASLRSVEFVGWFSFTGDLIPVYNVHYFFMILV